MTVTAPIPPAAPVEVRPAAPDRGYLKTALMIVLIVAVTGGAFWRVWLGSLFGSQPLEFVAWDDPKTIAGNEQFNPPTLKGLGTFWYGKNAPYLDLYIPVTYTVWHMVARIAELPLADEQGIALDPYPFHAANLLAHILSAVLVFLILRLLVPWEWGAFVGALIFALHPVQVEPVAWVSGFKDTLSGFFSLVAIWQYLLYSTRRQAGEEGAAWQVPYLLATVFFILAMLSKPSAVTLPVIVGIIDMGLLRRNWRDVSGPLWIWLLLSLFFLQIGRMAQQATALDFIPPLVTRPLLAMVALAFHLYHLVFPAGLAADYSLTPERLLKMPLTYVVWIIPAGIAALLYLYRRRAPWAVVAAGLFTAGVLPVLGLLPFDFQYYSAVADRYLYVAMLGPALLVGYILSLYPKPWLVGIFLVIAGALGARTYQQTGYWRDTQTLFEHTLEVNPHSLVAHMMLGNMYQERGAANPANYPRAAEHYRQAIKTKPNDAGANNNLGNVLVSQERVVESLQYYAVAVKNRPDNASFCTNYGLALSRLGRLDEASQQFTNALAVDPGYTAARVNLASAQMDLATNLAAAQNWAAAIPHFEAALKADRSLLAAQMGLAEARRRLGSRQ